MSRPKTQSLLMALLVVAATSSGPPARPDDPPGPMRSLALRQLADPGERPDSDIDALRDQGRALTGWFLDGHLDEVYSRFDRAMQARMPRDTLQRGLLRLARADPRPTNQGSGSPLTSLYQLPARTPWPGSN